MIPVTLIVGFFSCSFVYNHIHMHLSIGRNHLSNLKGVSDDAVIRGGAPGHLDVVRAMVQKDDDSRVMVGLC